MGAGAGGSAGARRGGSSGAAGCCPSCCRPAQLPWAIGRRATPAAVAVVPTATKPRVLDSCRPAARPACFALQWPVPAAAERLPVGAGRGVCDCLPHHHPLRCAHGCWQRRRRQHGLPPHFAATEGAGRRRLAAGRSGCIPILYTVSVLAGWPPNSAAAAPRLAPPRPSPLPPRPCCCSLCWVCCVRCAGGTLRHAARGLPGQWGGRLHKVHRPVCLLQPGQPRGKPCSQRHPHQPGLQCERGGGGAVGLGTGCGGWHMLRRCRPPPARAAIQPAACAGQPMPCV